MVNAPAPYGGRSSLGVRLGWAPPAIWRRTSVSETRLSARCSRVWFCTSWPSASSAAAWVAVAQPRTPKNVARTLLRLSVARIDVKSADDWKASSNVSRTRVVVRWQRSIACAAARLIGAVGTPSAWIVRVPETTRAGRSGAVSLAVPVIRYVPARRGVVR